MVVVDQSGPSTDPTTAAADGSRPSGAGRRRLDGFSLAGAAVALIGAGIGAQRLSDNSFLTHLASGRDMIDHGIVRTDQFTWTSVGEEVVLQSWLASLLYGLVDAVAGLGGVRLLMAATAALLAFLSWRATERSQSLATRVAIIVPILFIGLRTWSERPLLIGLVLLAVVLLAAEGKIRPRWLVVVGALWVNVHASWPLGLVLLGSRWAGGRLDRRDGAEPAAAGWLALGCVVGGVINPYGPSLLFFPVQLLGRNETLSLVAEWKSPSFDADWARAFLVLLVMAVIAVSRRSRWRLTLPMLLFVVAALVSRRNVPAASLVMLPVLAYGLPAVGTVDGRRSSPAVRAATVVVAALVVLVPVVGVRAPHFDGSRYPEAAVDAMEDAGLSPTTVRVVHQDFVGNYLGLRYREPVAWIDDRFELHPSELVDDYVVLLEAKAGWQEVLERYDAEALLWPADAPLTELVRDRSGWSAVYSDDDWAVLCRPDRAGC